jgi:hypothetical protein
MVTQSADGNSVTGEAMKNKSKLKAVARTAKKTWDDLFWDAAAQERDPVKNLRITKLISDAIREHEGNMRRSTE